VRRPEQITSLQRHTLRPALADRRDRIRFWPPTLLSPSLAKLRHRGRCAVRLTEKVRHLNFPYDKAVAGELAAAK